MAEGTNPTTESHTAQTDKEREEAETAALAGARAGGKGYPRVGYIDGGEAVLVVGKAGKDKEGNDQGELILRGVQAYGGTIGKVHPLKDDGGEEDA